MHYKQVKGGTHANRDQHRQLSTDETPQRLRTTAGRRPAAEMGRLCITESTELKPECCFTLYKVYIFNLFSPSERGKNYGKS